MSKSARPDPARPVRCSGDWSGDAPVAIPIYPLAGEGDGCLRVRRGRIHLPLDPSGLLAVSRQKAGSSAWCQRNIRIGNDFSFIRPRPSAFPSPWSAHKACVRAQTPDRAGRFEKTTKQVDYLANRAGTGAPTRASRSNRDEVEQTPVRACRQRGPCAFRPAGSRPVQGNPRRVPEVRHPRAAEGQGLLERSWLRSATPSRGRSSRPAANARGAECGALDIAQTGEAPPIFAQAAGPRLAYLAFEPPAPKGEAILVPANSPITSVADLKGKKIALNKGSNVHYLLVKALQSAGVGYEDVEPCSCRPPTAVPPSRRTRVDAWAIWDPFLASAESALGAKVLANAEGLAPNYQFYLGERSFLEANPEAAKELIAAIAEVGLWITGNPDAAAAELSPSTGIPEDVLKVRDRTAELRRRSDHVAGHCGPAGGRRHVPRAGPLACADHGGRCGGDGLTEFRSKRIGRRGTCRPLRSGPAADRPVSVTPTCVGAARRGPTILLASRKRGDPDGHADRAHDGEGLLARFAELYDFYAHGRITKREFLDRAGRFAVGGLTAAAILG